MSLSQAGAGPATPQFRRGRAIDTVLGVHPCLDAMPADGPQGSTSRRWVTKTGLLALALTVAALLAAPEAQAGIIRYVASLSGAAEAVPNASPGTGLATFDYDDVDHTLHIMVAFYDLLGPNQGLGYQLVRGETTA